MVGGENRMFLNSDQDKVAERVRAEVVERNNVVHLKLFRSAALSQVVKIFVAEGVLLQYLPLSSGEKFQEIPPD